MLQAECVKVINIWTEYNIIIINTSSVLSSTRSSSDQHFPWWSVVLTSHQSIIESLSRNLGFHQMSSLVSTNLITTPHNYTVAVGGAVVQISCDIRDDNRNKLFRQFPQIIAGRDKTQWCWYKHFQTFMTNNIDT